MKQRIITITVVIALIATIGFVLASNKKQIDTQNVVTDRSEMPVAVAVSKVGCKQWMATCNSRLP